jgi:hypothetical protein
MSFSKNTYSFETLTALEFWIKKVRATRSCLSFNSVFLFLILELSPDGGNSQQSQAQKKHGGGLGNQHQLVLFFMTFGIR